MSHTRYLSRFAVLASLIPFAGGIIASWEHKWATVGGMLWADFFARATNLTDEQLGFVAATYGIVSLEKCWTANDYSVNEIAIPGVANTLKTLNPSIKVLYYFHSEKSFGNCYMATTWFEKQPTMHLRDDSGVPYMNGVNHLFDLNQSAVREFVATASVNLSGAATLLDGVFADGANDQVSSFPGMAPTRFAAYQGVHSASLNATRAAVRAAMRPEAVLIANGISNYAINGIFNAPFVDGFCFEQ